MWRVEFVYSPEESGWCQDVPTMAAKIFPHKEGKHVILAWDDLDRIVRRVCELEDQIEQMLEDGWGEVETEG